MTKDKTYNICAVLYGQQHAVVNADQPNPEVDSVSVSLWCSKELRLWTKNRGRFQLRRDQPASAVTCRTCRDKLNLDPEEDPRPRKKPTRRIARNAEDR